MEMDDYADLEEVNDSGETLNEIEIKFQVKDEKKVLIESKDTIFSSIVNTSNQIIKFQVVHYRKKAKFYFNDNYIGKYMRNRLIGIHVYQKPVFQLAWNNDYGYCGERFGVLDHKLLKRIKKGILPKLSDSNSKLVDNLLSEYPFFEGNKGKFGKAINLISIEKAVTYKCAEYWIILDDPFKGMEVDLIECDCKDLRNNISLISNQNNKLNIMISERPISNYTYLLRLNRIKDNV